jgi:hypothetical protein
VCWRVYAIRQRLRVALAAGEWNTNLLNSPKFINENHSAHISQRLLCIGNFWQSLFWFVLEANLMTGSRKRNLNDIDLVMKSVLGTSLFINDRHGERLSSSPFNKYIMSRKRTLLQFGFTKLQEQMPHDTQIDTSEAVPDETAEAPPSDNTVQDRSCDNTATTGMQVGSADEPEGKKQKFTHVYQDWWPQKWPWLDYDQKTARMRCKLCVAASKSNTMTGEGTANFRTTTLDRHVTTSDHQSAVAASLLKKDFTVALDNAHKDPALTAAMRTAYYLAKEGLPISKFASLIEFQKLQGCPDIKNLSQAGNATYTSRQSAEDFQECIAQDIHEGIICDIKSANMYSIMIDESTDISVTKHMVINCRAVSPIDFTPNTYFLGNITIDDPKSTAEVLFTSLEQFLNKNGLPFSKLMAFGSDGAAVMTGKKNGVATTIREKSPHCINIHCLAHKFNLATSQASRFVPYLKDQFEKGLTDLFYYFGGSKSGNRKCELEQIQRVLQMDVVKIKEVHEIRWIASYEAVLAVHRSWKALVTYFERHTDKKCQELLEKLTDYRFAACIAMMMDILPAIAQVSLTLQKQDVDVAVVQPALENIKSVLVRVKSNKYTHHLQQFFSEIKASHNSQGERIVKLKGVSLRLCSKSVTVSREKFDEVRKTFVEALLKNISERFPTEQCDISMSFDVLSMRPLSLLSQAEREEYGNDKLDKLLAHYGQAIVSKTVTSPALVDPVQCKQEWQLAKGIVMAQMYPRDSTKKLLQILYTHHQESLPNLMKLAELALIMPYHTADCERAFSVQNHLKSDKRNRLLEKNLNVLMTIKVAGPAVSEYDFSKAVRIWRKKVSRRLCEHK